MKQDNNIPPASSNYARVIFSGFITFSVSGRWFVHFVVWTPRSEPGDTFFERNVGGRWRARSDEEDDDDDGADGSLIVRLTAYQRDGQTAAVCQQVSTLHSALSLFLLFFPSLPNRSFPYRVLKLHEESSPV